MCLDKDVNAFVAFRYFARPQVMAEVLYRMRYVLYRLHWVFPTLNRQ